MVRQVIKIDKEKCNGCGLCVSACHEGAIGLVDGKAELLRDDYCDGLGNCLPVCPTEAITFEEREAAAFDESAVKANMGQNQPDTLPCGCPGTNAKAINRECETAKPASTATGTATLPAAGADAAATGSAAPPAAVTQLNQWPVQIKLVPVNAPYFNNANLLISADCAAYAYGNFHQEFMRNKVTLIGCPKLDECDYAGKLTVILKENNIKSVTVVRMEVPCCGGIEYAVITALKNSGKMIPWQVVTISTDGQILADL